MTENINIYDQHTKPEAPEGKRAEWVRARTYRGGKTAPAQWRFVPIKRIKRGPIFPDTLPPYDPVSHRRKGPVPGKPRMTNPAHARHIYEQLAVPLAYFAALQSQDTPLDYAVVLNECFGAIVDARTFVNRFTTPDKEE